jgi:hypothetical protein
VRKLALECDGDEEFDSRIRAEVTRFDEMSAGYQNERRKLVKLSCSVGLSGLMQAVINTAMTATGDVSMAVTLIAAAVGTLGGLSQMDVSQFIDMRQEYHASNAYAVGSVYDYARKR